MLSHTTYKRTECYSCGEYADCTVYVSEMERETGYVDETAICEDCDGRGRDDE